MKTIRNFLIAASLLIITGFSGYASDVRSKAAFAPLMNTATIVGYHIAYPEFARDNKIEGFVLAEYEVNEEGKVHITAINGSDRRLMDYIYTKFNGLSLPETGEGPRYIRFIFKLH